MVMDSTAFWRKFGAQVSVAKGPSGQLSQLGPVWDLRESDLGSCLARGAGFVAGFSKGISGFQSVIKEAIPSGVRRLSSGSRDQEHTQTKGLSQMFAR
jgi:hypothetical protein